MANRPGHDIFSTAIDVADGIPVDTSVTYQVVGRADVLFFEGSEADRAAGNPNIVRGQPFFDPIVYTIGSDPIWAYCRSGEQSFIAVSY